MTNSIEVQGLRKSYGDFSLRDINLTVPGGAIMGLIGENGAGKTTTIKCILNLIRRDEGTITLLGHDNQREERAAKLEIGVVLDECFFHDSLRPRDIDLILSRIYQGWDSALYQRYLSKFQLPERKFVKEFSRGMKMKLSLAAALSHRPKLLILDEATAGLDPIVRDEILDEFLDLSRTMTMPSSSPATSPATWRRQLITSPISTRGRWSCPTPRIVFWTITVVWPAPPHS